MIEPTGTSLRAAHRTAADRSASRDGDDAIVVAMQRRESRVRDGRRA
jgi:hypothetical protein